MLSFALTMEHNAFDNSSVETQCSDAFAGRSTTNRQPWRHSPKPVQLAYASVLTIVNLSPPSEQYRLRRHSSLPPIRRIGNSEAILVPHQNWTQSAHTQLVFLILLLDVGT